MITATLERIAGKKPVALIIRHAERAPITRMVSAFDALLTEKGKSDAEDLGRLLAPFSPLKIYASPVERCLQTAGSLRTGADQAGGTASLEGALLDLGGPYLTGSWEEVSSEVERLGQPAFVRRWLAGGYPEDLLMDPARAGLLQMEVLAGQLRAGGASTVNITHDWNIMLLHAWAFRLSPEELTTPVFLDGLAAFREDGRIHIFRGGEERVIDMP